MNLKSRYDELNDLRIVFWNNGGNITASITPELLAINEKAGMLPLSTMEDGGYYLGFCRNSFIAKWSAEYSCFFYWRVKFGSTFLESINHPANDENYDIFIPLKKIDPKESELISAEAVKKYPAFRAARKKL